MIEGEIKRGYTMYSEVLDRNIDLDQIEDEIITAFFREKLEHIKKSVDDRAIHLGYRKKIHHSVKEYRQTEEYKAAFEEQLGRSKYPALAAMIDSPENLKAVLKKGDYIKAYKQYIGRLLVAKDVKAHEMRRKAAVEKIMAHMETEDFKTACGEIVEALTGKYKDRMVRYLTRGRLSIASHDYYYHGRRRTANTPVTVENIDFFIDDIAMDPVFFICEKYNNGMLFDVNIYSYLIQKDPVFKENAKDIELDDVIDLLSDGAMTIAAALADTFTEDYIEELIYNNKYLGAELKRLRNLKNNLLDTMPERYIDLYPAARRMHRHFVIHVGPTNSGKTYQSLEKLKTTDCGAYFGPLRLLAFEQFEKLNQAGTRCTLLTGEEHIEVPGATVTSSTIEMADLSKRYTTVVIDEAQMLADSARGGAWTDAILGICADQIEVCTAPTAVDIIVRLIEACGDDYEIVRHERFVPLIVEKASFGFPASVEKGDALVVFSKKNVHAVAADLQKKGKKVSVLYGALPYDVRHEEARRFAEGETDIVVCTDCIGMGMNLPIRRVVFLEVAKFDGKQKRILDKEEIKQIAGRAGRKGMFAHGYVNAEVEKNIIRKGIEIPSAKIRKIVMAFPESLIGLDENLSAIIKQWYKLPAPDEIEKQDIEDMIMLCEAAEAKGLDKKTIYDLITIPFDVKNEDLLYEWKRIVNQTAAGDTVKFEIPNYPQNTSNAENLDRLEYAYKYCDLYFSYGFKFGFLEGEETTIMETKEEIAHLMMEILKKNRLSGRKCKYCGRPLAWNYPYGMCNACHRKSF